VDRRITSIFVNHPLGLTVSEIAALTGAEIRAGARLGDVITSVAPLDRAGASELAFLDSGRFTDTLASTRAGACLVSERFESLAPGSLNVLRARDPYRAFVTVARHLFESALRPSSPYESNGIDPRAVIHPLAKLGPGVTIDPGAVIGPRVVIGAGTTIGANAVIGADVQIGRNCFIGPSSSIIHAIIGNNVICHSGCYIGQGGFRYVPGKDGHVKVPQIGRVIIQDNVEIGAGSAIDRGGLGDTCIGEGTKIDNLVHIAHNVSVGRHCIITGQCGLAGSVTMGDHVMLGGQVGIADHLSVGSRAMIGAKSGVVSDVPAGEKWLGYPAWPGREFLRAMTMLRHGTAKWKAKRKSSDV
jgi:UDP-3-O-[3-hydroxymyristoyl] glucosamine N-acyltransferase